MIQVAAAGSARHVAAVSEGSARRAEGRLPSKNERSLHRQQRFSRGESLPEMNSHSFSGMSVVKSLAYNGRFFSWWFYQKFLKIKTKPPLEKERKCSRYRKQKYLQSLQEELSQKISVPVFRDTCPCVLPETRELSELRDSLPGAGDFQHRSSLTRSSVLSGE